MKSPQEIKQHLSQFHSTENYYRHLFGFVYTDGVKTMAELCQAYWLLDAIGSYQPQCKRDEMLSEMQFWTLTVTDGSAVLICERDTNDIAIRQDIEFTDFPLPELKVWLERGSLDGVNPVMVAILPSER